METGIVIAIITGLTQVIKLAVNLKKRYIPIIAVLLGVALAFIYSQSDAGETIINGIILGLSSVGLYSGSKAIIKNK